MHTVNFLTKLVEHHQVFAYAVIFLGLIIEGEFILIATGVLAHLGAINFWFALFFVFCGGICKTFLGYYIGRALSDKWKHTKFLKHIEKKVLTIMPRFNHKPFWSIFISKFIMGVNHIVIIFAGYEKIPLKKYLKAEISSTIIWAPLLLSLGFFFSYTALGVSNEIWRFLLTVLLFIIGFIIFDRFIAFIYGIFEEFYDNGK